MYNMATKPSKRLYESKPMSMRDREIMEILDENLKAYKEVYKREFHQARLMNESYAPPNRFERNVAFQIDKYFSELQQAIDLSLETEEAKDSVAVLSFYEQLVDYIDQYTSKNSISQRDIATIEEKFDRIEPTIFLLAELADDRAWKQSKALNAVWHMIADRVYRSIKWELNHVELSPNKLVDRSNFRYKDSPNMPPIQPFAYFAPQIYEEPIKIDYQQQQFTPTTKPPLETIKRAARPVNIIAGPAKPSKKPSHAALADLRTLIELEADAQGFQLPAGFDIMKKKDLFEVYLDLNQVDRTQRRLVKQYKVDFEKLYQQHHQTINDTAAKRAAAQAEMDIEEGLFDPEPIPGQAGPAPAAKPAAKAPKAAPKPARPGPAPAPLAPPAQGFGRSKRDVEENVILNINEKKKHRSKHRHKKDRFNAGMFGGVGGDTEGDMGGLPAGFNNALKLRPMDKAPIKFYDTGLGLDGTDEGLTLEDKMQFLNRLDKHAIPDEENEWKLNSTQNLRKAMEKRVKKMK